MIFRLSVWLHNRRQLRSGKSWFFVFCISDRSWMSTCHTVGDTIWVYDYLRAEAVHAVEAKRILDIPEHRGDLLLFPRF